MCYKQRRHIRFEVIHAKKNGRREQNTHLIRLMAIKRTLINKTLQLWLIILIRKSPKKNKKKRKINFNHGLTNC